LDRQYLIPFLLAAQIDCYEPKYNRRILLDIGFTFPLEAKDTEGEREREM
jgi:hypothetical protein